MTLPAPVGEACFRFLAWLSVSCWRFSRRARVASRDFSRLYSLYLAAKSHNPSQQNSVKAMKQYFRWRNVMKRLTDLRVLLDVFSTSLFPAMRRRKLFLPNFQFGPNIRSMVCDFCARAEGVVCHDRMSEGVEARRRNEGRTRREIRLHTRVTSRQITLGPNHSHQPHYLFDQRNQLKFNLRSAPVGRHAR